MSRRRRLLLQTSSPVPPADAFTSSWKTNNAGTSSSTSITIPTDSSATYDCYVTYGSNPPVHITTYDDPAWTHDFGVAGTYTVLITGDFTWGSFNNGGDKLKLVNISKWDIFKFSNLGGYFYGCGFLTITATDVPDLNGCTDFSRAFTNCVGLIDVPNIGLWDMSTITTFNLTFGGCTNFNADIGAWDVSSCEDFTFMFTSARAFNQAIGNWDVSSAIIMAGMFSGAILFNQEIGGWNVSFVTNFSAMFQSAYAFNQDIGSWNVSSAVDMAVMFNSAESFNYSIALWNTINVTNMDGMFNNATAYNSSLAGLIFENVTTAVGFLDNCPSFSTSNYDAFLVGLNAQPVLQTGVILTASLCTYTIGSPAEISRMILTTSRGYSIADAGGVP